MKTTQRECGGYITAFVVAYTQLLLRQYIWGAKELFPGSGLGGHLSLNRKCIKTCFYKGTPD